MAPRHRVVVEIDEDLRESKVEEFSNVLDLRVSRAFVPSVDPRSLNVFDSPSKCYGGHPMRFDCVGTSRNSFTRAEISMLMDQLLLQKSNCCVIKVNATRDYQLAFLCNLLVTEVDKRMLLMQSKLHTIKVEYYDVRKYDVVNLLAEAEKSHKTRSHRVLQPHLTFSNTLDLLKWLQSKYLTNFNCGSGHESIEVQFMFTDSRHYSYNVKLSLMILYLEKMDSDTKTCLRNYFENIFEQSKQKMKNLMLTDCFKEVFNTSTKWYSWFIFHVPIAKGSGVVIDDLLKLANAAYSGLNAPITADGEEEQTEYDYDLDSMLSFLQKPSRKEPGVSFDLSGHKSQKSNDANKSKNLNIHRRR